MNTQAADEVVEFARSGPLLSGSMITTSAKILVLDDFNAAQLRATRQPDPDSPWSVDWTDLREGQAGSLLALKYQLPDDQRELVNRVSNDIANALSKTLRPRLRALGFERVHNEVSTDLWKVATSRLLQGPTHDFWEAIFALYRQGLWPCGWDGPQYPSGRFVTFSSKPSGL